MALVITTQTGENTSSQQTQLLSYPDLGVIKTATRGKIVTRGDYGLIFDGRNMLTITRLNGDFIAQKRVYEVWDVYLTEDGHPIVRSPGTIRVYDASTGVCTRHFTIPEYSTFTMVCLANKTFAYSVFNTKLTVYSVPDFNVVFYIRDYSMDDPAIIARNSNLMSVEIEGSILSVAIDNHPSRVYDQIVDRSDDGRIIVEPRFTKSGWSKYTILDERTLEVVEDKLPMCRFAGSGILFYKGSEFVLRDNGEETVLGRVPNVHSFSLTLPTVVLL
jgi:hypothetical protein